jgi:hypothetical protein
MICRTGRLASGNYHVIVPVLDNTLMYEKHLGTEDSEFDGVDVTGCPGSVIWSGIRMLA